MMKKWIRSAVTGMLLLSMLSASGCSSEQGAGQEAKTDMTIAVICKNKKDSYWNSVFKACDDVQEEMGITILQLAPEVEDVNDQISMIDNAVAQKVDAIVLAAIDQNAENEAVDKAITAGIPVVTIDSDVSYAGRACYVGTQNTSAAAIAARYAEELLGTDGSVGIVYHGNTLTADLRKNGFTDQLAFSQGENNIMPAGAGSKQNNSQSGENAEETAEQMPEEAGEPAPPLPDNNIKVSASYDGEGDQIVSCDAVKELITKDHVNLVYTTNQPGTIGACDAIKELVANGTLKSEDEVQLVGFDYFDGAFEYVTSGVLDGVIVQNPYNMGYLGIRYAKKLAEGVQKEEIPAVIDTGAILVTKDNINEDDIKFLIGSTDTEGGQNNG